MQRSAQKRQKELARQQRQRDKMAARVERKKGRDEGGGPVQDGLDGVIVLDAGAEPQLQLE